MMAFVNTLAAVLGAAAVIAIAVAVKLWSMGSWQDASDWWRRERERWAASKRWR